MTICTFLLVNSVLAICSTGLDACSWLKALRLWLKRKAFWLHLMIYTTTIGNPGCTWLKMNSITVSFENCFLVCVPGTPVWTGWTGCAGTDRQKGSSLLETIFLEEENDGCYVDLRVRSCSKLFLGTSENTSGTILFATAPTLNSSGWLRGRRTTKDLLDS